MYLNKSLIEDLNVILKNVDIELKIHYNNPTF